jgi:lipoate-protein ligase A
VQVWDLIVHAAPLSGTTNMAIDAELLRTAPQRNRPLLRIYSWKNPAISHGYFQKPPQNLEKHYEIVRRPTGGGIVFHGEDTTYTLVFPRNFTDFSYKTVHEAVREALRLCGIHTEIVGSCPRPHSNFCFQAPVCGDLLGPDGKKIAGAAQRRTKFAVLHQGSIAAKVPDDALIESFSKFFGIRFCHAELVEASPKSHTASVKTVSPAAANSRHGNHLTLCY